MGSTPEEKRPGMAPRHGIDAKSVHFDGTLSQGINEQKFLLALQDCPPPGAGKTHAWKLRAANYGIRARLDPATVESAMLAALGSRAAEKRLGVRAAIEKVVRELGMKAPRFRPSNMPNSVLPKPAPLTAAEFIRRGNGATEATLRAMSPLRIDWPLDDRWRDACAFLQALFKPDELVACGGKDWKVPLPCAEWCQRFQRREAIPELVIVNPVKPGGGRRKRDGRVSWFCDDAVAEYRNTVIEFDHIPLAVQISFWVGFGVETASAITFSGGKSLHAVVPVNLGSSSVVDQTVWDREVREGLFRRLIPLGADPQCQNPSRSTRLAGARRADKDDAVQRLLYVARPLPEWQKLEERAVVSESAGMGGAR